MSLQVQIMLVLAGHPSGRATLADMNADLVILAGAGPGWTQRIKRLASNAPGLDIFTEGYVIRDAAGWEITDAGRKALKQMNSAAPALPAEALVPPVVAKPAIAIVARSAAASAPLHTTKIVSIADRRRHPRRAV